MRMHFSGTQLRKARRARGLTQAALAQRCGIHHDAVRNLERAHRKPSVTLLVSIATELDITVNDLFEDASA